MNMVDKYLWRQDNLNTLGMDVRYKLNNKNYIESIVKTASCRLALGVFILTPALITGISGGIMISFPSVLIPALTSTNNTDIQATTTQISWMAASNGIGGMIGFFVLSPIMQIFGRKAVQITSTSSLAVGWIIMALAHSSSALLAARTIQGVAFGCFFLHAMIISEYSDRKRRGYFMTFKKSVVVIGAVLCHALPLIWNWRQIAILGIIITIISVVLTLFWPESPSFLAMKGRFEESKKSFVWLYGRSNLQEFNLLHLSQLQKVKNTNTEKWYKFLLKKDFLKPFVIVSLLTVILELSGKHYFAVYVIQMMMDLVQQKSLAVYFSIGADIFTFIALMSSYFVIKHFNRRTILFYFGVVTVVLMLLICFVIILKISNIVWLSPLLIVLHSFIVNISIIPVGFTLLGEIFPLEYKGYGSFLGGIIFTIIYTLMLKVTPVIIESTGVGGIYLIYGCIIAVCLIILYFLLPETKDRSLQEIENEFKGIDLSNCDEKLRLQITQ